MTVLCTIETNSIHLVNRPKNDENSQTKEFYFMVKKVVHVQAMKAYRKNSCIAPLINLGIRVVVSGQPHAQVTLFPGRTPIPTE
jgi:hypothetical protein